MGINWMLHISWGNDSSLVHSKVSVLLVPYQQNMVYNYICANGIKKSLFYWYLHCVTVCLRRSYPMVFLHIVQCSLFLIARHSVWNSLQFIQWLVMLQCSGQSYGSSVRQWIVPEAVVRYNQKKYSTTRKFNVSVAMAMITPYHQAVIVTGIDIWWFNFQPSIPAHGG